MMVLNLHHANLPSTGYKLKSTKIHYKFQNFKHKPNVNQFLSFRALHQDITRAFERTEHYVAARENMRLRWRSEE